MPRAEERGEVAGLADITNPGAARHPTRQATMVRDAFLEYFNGVGSVPWHGDRHGWTGRAAAEQLTSDSANQR